jgi:2-methylfumaryl-CoA isomerase
MFQTINQPGVGPYLASGEMLDFSALPRGETKPAPRIGDNTDEVLASVLGLSDGEIGKLHDKKIVSGVI